MSRCCTSRATGPLVGCGAADFFYKQRVDTAIRVIAGNTRQAAVEHQAHTIDGERGFRDVGGDDDFAPVIAGHRCVLIPGLQFAMQRKHDKLRAEGIPRRLHGAVDLIRPGHENKRVALRMLAYQPLEFFDCKLPHRCATGRFGQIFNGDRISAAFGGQYRARLEILLNRGDIQRGRHDDDNEIGPRRFLDLQSAGQGDVAVEMPFVKFVEDDGADTLQVRISQHPTQHHAFRNVTDPRSGRGNIIEPHLIPDLAAELNVSRLRDPTREHARGQPARL